MVVTLLMAAPAIACSFNATGLGPSEEGEPGTTQGPGTGPTAGPGTTGGVTGEAVTEGTGVATEGGEGTGTGTSGGAMPGTEASSTGTTLTTDAPGTTTEEASSSGSEGGSSTGCVTQDYFLDMDGDQHGDPGKVMTVCGAPPAGYVAVGDDCEDDKPDVYPGRDEICDQKDNDCDDLTDEFSPTNGDCDDCKMFYNDTTKHLYHFCSKNLSWKDAGVLCVARSAKLARDDGGTEHNWLVSKLPGDSGAWYIGGSAPNKDDKFVWEGGDPVSDSIFRWGFGRPDGDGDTQYLSLVSKGFNLETMLGGSSTLWHDLADKDHTHLICEGDPP